MAKPADNICFLYDQIAAIENNPDNVIGGSKAFFSGKKTYLKDSVLRKIAKLNEKIEKLAETMEDA
ncbi:MAG TPA: hypothetical protein VJL10_09330 [Anaerolineales bacterium]|nr:hypothetical protein [Anaerolineales bacterium]